MTSVFRSTPLASSPKDAPHRRVDLLDHVAIKPLRRLASKWLTDVEWHVGHRVRQVEEERLILVPIDERDGAPGVEAGQAALVFIRDFRIDDFVSLDQRERRIVTWRRVRVEWPHVIGIRKAEVFVKPVVNRQEPGMMSEVPLAGDACGVSLSLEELGEGYLTVGDTVLRLGPKRAESRPGWDSSR